MSFHKQSIIILCFVFIFMAAAILSGCDNAKPAPTATVAPTEVPAEPTKEAAVVEEASAEQPAEPTKEVAAVEEASAEAPAETTEEAAAVE